MPEPKTKRETKRETRRSPGEPVKRTRDLVSQTSRPRRAKAAAPKRAEAVALKERSAKPLSTKRGSVSKPSASRTKKAKKISDRYREIGKKGKQKFKDIEKPRASVRGGKSSRFADTDKAKKFKPKKRSKFQKSIEENFSNPVIKSASYVKPFADRVLNKKMSLKDALDRVPWFMQDDLLSYLRDKKKK